MNAPTTTTPPADLRAGTPAKGRPAPPPSPPPSNGNGLPANLIVPTLGKAEAKFQPPRIVVNGVEGWGKTTLAAFAPNPAILMARGETGYETLLGAGTVPNVDRSLIDTWPGLLALLDQLADRDDLPYKTLALDAMGGFERLCHEHVCTRDFKGEWGEKGFSSYQKGYDVSVTDWLGFLQRLDKINQRGVMILILAHCQVRPFKNPLAEDYDHYIADVHYKTWGVTHKWVDAVFFANFVTVIDIDKKKGNRPRGIGGNDRIIFTQHHDAYDAKNRYSMQPEIDIPADPKQMWPTLWAAIKGDGNGKETT